MDLERADWQLRLISETLAIAESLDVEVWLRGGWAMDFFLGEVTRDHEDIDWFTWVGDGSGLLAELERRGWERLIGPPPDQQFDLVRDGLECGFGLLDKDEAGRVVVGSGPWAGEAFPEAQRADQLGRIGSFECPIVSPEGQIEIKRMMPTWVLGRPRRAKDAKDVARLETALRARESDAESAPSRSLE